ncbi:LDLR chaperone boca-like [Asterias rubens]|uniref:LDLR chaperone boca-like n=1 Tax=Asterias rubens TaxID=7604 RepID=UPI0014556F82|nr:LDLR chaperone boca-like [Asterias rubens]
MAEENFGLRKLWTVFFVMMILAVLLEVNAEKKKNSDDDKQKKKKKKDLRDYNDADLERLFDEWEDAEDEHDPDDLPEHKRPSPTIDMSKMDLSNPESAMKLTKKGKTLMMFVSVSGDPTQEETDDITVRWQSQLFNAHFNFQRYPVSSDRVIFLLTDGSVAWEIKDFLIQQDRCKEVSIESQVYYGKGSGKEVGGKGVPIDKDEL